MVFHRFCLLLPFTTLRRCTRWRTCSHSPEGEAAQFCKVRIGRLRFDFLLEKVASYSGRRKGETIEVRAQWGNGRWKLGRRRIVANCLGKRNCGIFSRPDQQTHLNKRDLESSFRRGRRQNASPEVEWCECRCLASRETSRFFQPISSRHFGGFAGRNERTLK